MSKIHQGRVDKNGNYRGTSRKNDGYLLPGSDGMPFPALVTAWFPKSQTMNVVVPTRFGQTIFEGVVIYGNFFEATGSIQGPKIGTQKKDDGYTTILEEDQKDSTSNNYVLDNHIEALVFKTSVGYAASCFRFLNPDSPMLNNVKYGRKITRHDDGSYFIHDDDGNFQFKHPSGLDIKVGDSVDDIELDTPFPEHEKNKQAYAGGLKAKIEIPINDTDKHLINIDPSGAKPIISINHATEGVIELDGTNLKLTQQGTTLDITNSGVAIT